MAGTVRIAIIADGSKAVRELNAVARSSSTFGSKVAKSAKIAAVGIGGVTAAASVFTYKVGSDYVNSLNQIQALTGANTKQMKAAASQLEKNSSLYAKYGLTTGDAAAGVVELTKSGQSLRNSLKEVNATMVLAKAGELSVADASTLVANSLNTFSLKAKSAGKISNQLANAANISSADVSDLAESFKYVSPVAAAAGLKMGQVNAILAELSNSGIKASQAGTTLRTFLLNLQAPAKAGADALDSLNVSVFAADGKLKPLPLLIDQLSASLKGLPAQEKAADLKAIFGKTGISGATAILKAGGEGLKEYTRGVNRAGAANKLAKAKSQGLAGEFASIKAQVTSAAQEIYRKYSPALDERLRKFIAQMKSGKGAGGAFADALRDVRDIAVDLWPAIQKTAHFTGQFLDYLAKHKSLVVGLAGGLAALKAAQVTNKITGGALTKSITGGVQKVFVVNWGAGGPGGGLGGGLKNAGRSGGAGLLAALGSNPGLLATLVTIGDMGNEVKQPGTTGPASHRFTGPVRPVTDFPGYSSGLKSTATQVDALNAKLSKSSQAIDLVGRSADRAFNKDAAQGIKSTAASLSALTNTKAAGAFDVIGHSASANSTKAIAGLTDVTGAVNRIPPEKKIDVKANTGAAMAALQAIQAYTIHDKSFRVTQYTNSRLAETVKRASGGYVSGPGGPRSDSILARLSNGEFVVNAAATKRHLALLRAINSGRRLLGFAGGGQVGGGSSSGSALGLTGSLKGLKQSIDETSKSLDKARQTASNLASAQRDLAQTVASSLRSDIFGQQSVWSSSSPLGILRTDIANARNFNKSLHRLSRSGVHGAALAAVAASGNLQVARQLEASPRAFQRLYGERQRLTADVGQFAAQQRYGETLVGIHEEIRGTNKRLDRLEAVEKRLAAIEKHTKDNPKATGRETAKALDHAGSDATRRRRRQS